MPVWTDAIDGELSKNVRPLTIIFKCPCILALRVIPVLLPILILRLLFSLLVEEYLGADVYVGAARHPGDDVRVVLAAKALVFQRGAMVDGGVEVLRGGPIEQPAGARVTVTGDDNDHNDHNDDCVTRRTGFHTYKTYQVPCIYRW